MQNNWLETTILLVSAIVLSHLDNQNNVQLSSHKRIVPWLTPINCFWIWLLIVGQRQRVEGSCGLFQKVLSAGNCSWWCRAFRLPDKFHCRWSCKRWNSLQHSGHEFGNVLASNVDRGRRKAFSHRRSCFNALTKLYLPHDPPWEQKCCQRVWSNVIRKRLRVLHSKIKAE